MEMETGQPEVSDRKVTAPDLPSCQYDDKVMGSNLKQEEGYYPENWHLSYPCSEEKAQEHNQDQQAVGSNPSAEDNKSYYQEQWNSVYWNKDQSAIKTKYVEPGTNRDPQQWECVESVHNQPHCMVESNHDQQHCIVEASHDQQHWYPDPTAYAPHFNSSYNVQCYAGDPAGGCYGAQAQWGDATGGYYGMGGEGGGGGYHYWPR